MKAEMHRQILRGRRPVRTDCRLFSDDEAVRKQSAILDKTQTVFLFFHNPVFDTDVSFIRIENRVGARSAQWAQVNWAGVNGRIERQRSISHKGKLMPKPDAKGDKLGVPRD